VATMKTIRQVKTVFVIFIVFVCCWSPYIVVLLYDNSDSLPLPVHLYASMLAHLHASLNFTIYGLINRNLRSVFVTHLLFCCRHLTANIDIASVPDTFDHLSAQRAIGRRTENHGDGACVSRPLLTLERCQLLQIDDDSSNMRRFRRPPISINTTDDRSYITTTV